MPLHSVEWVSAERQNRFLLQVAESPPIRIGELIRNPSPKFLDRDINRGYNNARESGDLLDILKNA